MARDKDQVFIFNNDELQLIKNVFADNEELLYAVRSVFLQFPLSDAQKEMIKTQVTPPVINALRKRILPEISDEFPLTQLPSLLTTLTEQLKVKDVQEMAPQFEAKMLQIKYLEQQFAVLAGEDVEEKIRLIELGSLEEMTNDGLMAGEPVNPHMGSKSPYRAFVHSTAYLFLLGYIDPMLNFIRTIAGQKGETLEQLTERLRRDSSK
jgi:hypothetical protein